MLLMMMMLLKLHLVDGGVLFQSQRLARLHGPGDCGPEALLEGHGHGIVLIESMEDDADAGNDEDEDGDDRQRPTEMGRPFRVVVPKEGGVDGEEL